MADAHKYQAHEVLNRVLNAGEDGLNVDLADSVTVTVDSEFPAAAAITDNFANPTTTSAMSMLMGYDGSAWDRVTIGGGTEATALRVTIASDSTGVVSVDDGGGALTVDGTVTANLGTTDNAVLDAIAASLAVLDDWDDSNYANVNANIAGTDIVGGAGAVASGVQRVTLASDDPAVTSLGNLDNAVDGNYLNVNMNLDGSDAQAGEGTISATTQRVTIATDDDGVAHLATIAGAVSTQMQVDIVADGAGLATSANQLADGHNVTIDNSSGGSAVNIQDGGNTITVDGTVTANLSATDNAVLDTIDAVLDTIKTDTGTIDSDTDAIKTATESSNTHLGNMFYDTALAVTPSDGSDLTGEPFYAVYVGTGGDLKVDMSDGGSAVTLSNVASGQLLPIMVERIYSTGTTASNIIAFK